MPASHFLGIWRDVLQPLVPYIEGHLSGGHRVDIVRLHRIHPGAFALEKGRKFVLNDSFWGCSESHE